MIGDAKHFVLPDLRRGPRTTTLGTQLAISVGEIGLFRNALHRKRVLRNRRPNRRQNGEDDMVAGETRPQHCRAGRIIQISPSFCFMLLQNTSKDTPKASLNFWTSLVRPDFGPRRALAMLTVAGVAAWGRDPDFTFHHEWRGLRAVRRGPRRRRDGVSCQAGGEGHAQRGVPVSVAGQ